MVGKSAKEKGSEAEKYIAAYLQSRGYETDIHPRTTTFTGKFYISRENDFYGIGDVLALGPGDAIMAQVTDMADDGTDGMAVQGGNVSYRRDKIDKRFPHNFPYMKFIVFLTQKRWVSKPRRHKEYFHRAWVRESGASGPVWVEREGWSSLGT